MSQTITASVESAMIEGDLSRLTAQQRVEYYAKTCESLGLNPFTKPFEYIKLNGQLRLYARKDATDQIRKLNRISISIASRDHDGDLYRVSARAVTPDGRTDEDEGVVNIAGLKGENLANAYMKAATKAKRRVTLSIVGLGWLDESEVDSIPGAQKVRVDPESGTIEEPPRQFLPPTPVAHGDPPSHHNGSATPQQCAIRLFAASERLAEFYEATEGDGGQGATTALLRDVKIHLGAVNIGKLRALVSTEEQSRASAERLLDAVAPEDAAVLRAAGKA